MAQFGGLFSQLQRSTYWTRVWSLRCFSEKNKVVRETKRVTIANGLFAILVHITHTRAQIRKPHTANSHSFLKTATLIITNDKVAHPNLLLLTRPPQFLHFVQRVKRERTVATGSKSHLYSVTCHCLFIISIILISAQCVTHSPDVIWAE